MAPTHRINKPMKSEKTTGHYCFSEPWLPLPQGERVSLPTKRRAWGLSSPAADPSLRCPAAWPVCLRGEHMLSVDHHCLLSGGPSLPLERPLRHRQREATTMRDRTWKEETSGLVKKGSSETLGHRGGWKNLIAQLSLGFRLGRVQGGDHPSGHTISGTRKEG